MPRRLHTQEILKGLLKRHLIKILKNTRLGIYKYGQFSLLAEQGKPILLKPKYRGHNIHKIFSKPRQKITARGLQH